MIREKNGQHVLTDQKNVLVDVHFGSIASPTELARKLEVIPGIAEHGLFIDYTNAAIVAGKTSAVVLRKNFPSEAAEKFSALPSA